MRKIVIAAIATTAAFTSLAHAGGAVNSVTATDTVQVQGARYKMDAKEFSEFKGSYQMADGSVLTLSNAKNKFYASVDGKAATEIVPVANNAFNGRNGEIKISFDEFRDGRSHDVVLAR